MRAHAYPPTLRAELAQIGATPSPVRLSLPAQPRNVAVVRRALEAIAEELALPRRLTQDMRLAVTEACTNVVRHAYDDVERENANAMRVDLLPSEHAMDVIVEDRGRGLGPSPRSDARGTRIAMSFAPASIEAA